MRIGIGFDSHRFRTETDEANGGALRLGGVDVPFSRSLLGHSDADALLHAITDALLGAAGLGDIGEMFPDTAKENRGRDSAEMLALAAAEVRTLGYRIANIDTVVFAERPRLGPYKSAMKERIAAILALPPEKVNVKAKTGEGVGVIGRGEAISAEAIALLEENRP